MSKGIRHIFSQVPDTYEAVNHVLTFGLDILWRKKAVRLAVKDGGKRWMDVCTGTGETAAYLQRFAPAGVQVYATDFSGPMLGQARKKKQASHIAFSLSDVKHLPFPDNSFDLLTISFATRNINVNYKALLASFSEFHRVLKPGGRFVNVETSQPSFTPLRRLFHAYIKTFVKPVGALISGSKAGYAYLSNTIPRFYNAHDLEEILKTAGFSQVEVKSMLFGIAAIHKAIKLGNENRHTIV